MRKEGTHIVSVARNYTPPFRMKLALAHTKESQRLTDLRQCFCLKLKSSDCALGHDSDRSIKAPLGLELLLMWVVSLRTQAPFWT